MSWCLDQTWMTSIERARKRVSLEERTRARKRVELVSSVTEGRERMKECVTTHQHSSLLASKSQELPRQSLALPCSCLSAPPVVELG